MLTQSAECHLPKEFHIYRIFSLSQVAPSTAVAQKFPLLLFPLGGSVGSGDQLLYRILQLLLLIPTTLMQDLEAMPASLYYLVLSLCAVHSLLTLPPPTLAPAPPPPPPPPPHLSNLFHCLGCLSSLVKTDTLTGTEQTKKEHIQRVLKRVVSQVYSTSQLNRQSSLFERVFLHSGSDPLHLQLGEEVSIPLPAAGVPPRLYADHILGILSTKDGQPRWGNKIHLMGIIKFSRRVCTHIHITVLMSFHTTLYLGYSWHINYV